MARPHKYKSAADLQSKIDDYFKTQTRRKKPPTVSGLCFHLGYEDRFAIYKLAKHELFGHVIKSTMNRIMASYEELLVRPCNNGGVMFFLKNHGWRDNLDVTSGGEKIAQSQVIVQSAETVSLLATAISEIN